MSIKITVKDINFLTKCINFSISNPNFNELLYNSRRLKNLTFTLIPSSHLLYIIPHHRNHYTQNIFPTKPIHKILSQISTFNLV